MFLTYPKPRRNITAIFHVHFQVNIRAFRVPGYFNVVVFLTLRLIEGNNVKWKKHPYPVWFTSTERTRDTTAFVTVSTVFFLHIRTHLFRAASAASIVRYIQRVRCIRKWTNTTTRNREIS